MSKRNRLLLPALLLVGSAAAVPAAPGLRAPNSCISNPPPACNQYDQVCLAKCDEQFPRRQYPEENCLCKIGCCIPID